MFTYSQLAKNFRQVHADLQAHIDAHGMREKIVEMDNPYDNREPRLPLCKTPACHGGEFAILYGARAPFYMGSFYCTGADMVAEKLGFLDRLAYASWAHDNPDLWGNRYGHVMWSNCAAFGVEKKHAHSMTLQHVCDWYEKVADNIERLRKPEQKLDTYYTTGFTEGDTDEHN